MKLFQIIFIKSNFIFFLKNFILIFIFLLLQTFHSPKKNKKSMKYQIPIQIRFQTKNIQNYLQKNENMMYNYHLLIPFIFK